MLLLSTSHTNDTWRHTIRLLRAANTENTNLSSVHKHTHTDTDTKLIPPIYRVNVCRIQLQIVQLMTDLSMVIVYVDYIVYYSTPDDVYVHLNILLRCGYDRGRISQKEQS